MVYKSKCREISLRIRSSQWNPYLYLFGIESTSPFSPSKSNSHFLYLFKTNIYSFWLTSMFHMDSQYVLIFIVREKSPAYFQIITNSMTWWPSLNHFVIYLFSGMIIIFPTMEFMYTNKMQSTFIKILFPINLCLTLCGCCSCEFILHFHLTYFKFNRSMVREGKEWRYPYKVA